MRSDVDENCVRWRLYENAPGNRATPAPMKAYRRAQSVAVVWVAILTVLFVRPLAARAGNDDALPIGLDAAQAGAAVTAISTGGAAGYYNPAGLAASVAPTLDANLNAYGVRLYRVPRLLEGPAGRSSGVRVFDTVIVPTLFAHVMRLNFRWVASGGIYIPKAQSYSLSARLRTANGTDWRITQDATADLRYFVLGLGARISERLRLGVSVLASAESSRSLLSVAGQDPAATAPGLSLLSDQGRGEYGGSLRVGGQWDVSKVVTLGATLISPTLIVAHRERDLTVANLRDAGSGASSGFYGDTSKFQIGAELGGAPSLRVGGALSHGRGVVLADATLNFPSDAPAIAQDRKLSWNLRAGTLYTLSQTWRLGAGLFTDRNPLKQPGIDDYGVTLGGSHTTRYELRDGRTIAFISGASLRYAFGIGKIQGIKVPGAAAAGSEFESISTDATNHELSVNIGTGVTL